MKLRNYLVIFVLGEKTLKINFSSLLTL